MTSEKAWDEDPYFDLDESRSLDGGATSQGALWHAVNSRWGHAMHTMCSYHGMFPAKMVHYFVQRYSSPGDLVVDPFSGRGTTVLQSRVEGRRTVGNDLSPLGFVLSKAKAAPPTWLSVMGFVDQLESDFHQMPGGEPDVSEDVRMLFHPNTLRQLWFLRATLCPENAVGWSPQELMVGGCIAGMLHGATRKDGSSAYLSVSMPNTFSMSPTYVRKYIDENGLTAPDQDVFARLREKIARQYLDDVQGPDGAVHFEDAGEVLSRRELSGKVDLVLTSPPYLQVVNYGQSNWIRLWWLGVDDVSRQRGSGRVQLDGNLDHAHGYDGYFDFMLRIFKGTAKALRADGVAVFIIGDVATQDGTSAALATRLWDAVGAQSGLALVDVIEDDLPMQKKVSRIWGESRGRATERERVLVLGRADGEPRTPRIVVDWVEPYKDAGPDATHALAGSRVTHRKGLTR